MKDLVLTIVENKKITNDIYLLKLEGDCTSIKGSGQFAELKLHDYYLRRPLSIHDYTENSVSFLYKILGHGTKDLTHYAVGDKMDVILDLGHGFDIEKAKKPLLVAGGIGLAPLYHLAKEFNKRGIRPTCILGFRNKDEIYYEEEFKKYCDTFITTDDGSYGFKGNAVTYLKSNDIDYDYYYACGPQIMLKYLALYSTKGCVSLEARMGCGFGACMGCSVETTKGPKRVCKEGPVFEASEVKF